VIARARHPRRLGRVDPRATDWILCATFAALVAIDVASGLELEGPVALNVLAIAVLVALPLLRRRAPLGAIFIWSAVLIAMASALTNPYEMTSAFIGLFVYPYAAGAYGTGRRVLLAVPAIWLALTAMALAHDPFVWGDIFFPSTFGTMFLIAGRAVRNRARLTAELHEAAVRAGEERDADALRAIADERRRIAREMHDVVAHSVSMMVIQAGGARRILERDPGRAAEAAELIERTGREALGEMRHLLGLLHADDEPLEYAPQPTLLELDAVLERVRATGMQVSYAVEGQRRELPAGLDLAAFRVVQEALTNAVRHGGGAATEVRVRYENDAVEVMVADSGDGRLDVRLDGSGHGLTGMRERVRVYGGELHAGRRAGGGFEVRARLPLLAEDEAALTAGAR
jgi:signal transduction histidine kinase